MGNVETIVKINKNIIFNGYAYRGKINLIKYSDRYEHDKAYNMEYVSDDGICFAYAGCDGDNYDRGYYIDRIMCQIIKLLEDRQRKEIKSVRKCYDYKRKNDLEGNNDNGKVFLLSDICNYFYIEPKNEKRKRKRKSQAKRQDLHNLKGENLICLKKKLRYLLLNVA